MGYRDQMTLQDLVGLVVRDARYDKDNIYLNLVDGTCVALMPEGDCCANCFIEHVSIAYALTDAVIASVENIDGERKEDDSGVDEDWGHRITTNKGVCSIEMRVTHNGYYGGCLNVGVCPSNNSPVLDDF